MEYKIVVSIALGVLGLVLGSFAGATTWRLRARQLREDARHGEKVSSTEKRQVAKLQPKSLTSDRSVCLHCGHELRWYDLVPLVSWLSLRGKCRYCHKSIGWFEPVIELGLAVFFVISYLFWPSQLLTVGDITQYIIWLAAGVGVAILFAYDMKWFLLPNVVVFPLIGLGVLNAAIVLVEGHFGWTVTLSILSSCAILSGLYYLIYVFSGRQWVGFGDVKLGLALALLLADWQLAILALFLANLIGTIIFLPFLLTGKLQRQTHIPFGPLLISGWAIAGLFGTSLLSWYIALTLSI
jgi:prepilin signal peptidase PulO-like enzyme (type II secretory pathway)